LTDSHTDGQNPAANLHEWNLAEVQINKVAGFKNRPVPADTGTGPILRYYRDLDNVRVQPGLLPAALNVST